MFLFVIKQVVQNIIVKDTIILKIFNSKLAYYTFDIIY